MTRSDYLIFITSQFLQATDASIPGALKSLSERYVTDKLHEPEKVALGGRSISGEELAFATWLENVRSAKIKNVKGGQLSHSTEILSPVIAHAFAGPTDIILSVTTALGSYQWHLNTLYSARHEITPQLFGRLIDHQKNRDILWDRIADLILESNELNGRPGFEKKNVRKYFVDASADYGFDNSVSNIFQEVQIELKMLSALLEIPEDLKSLLSVPDSSSLASEEDKDHVFLYPLKDASGEELIALVRAQVFSPIEVWIKTNDIIKSYQDFLLPDLPPEEWENYLLSKTATDLSTAANAICRAIADICEEKNIKRILPTALQEIFGPDDDDNRRANFRSKTEGIWYLEDNKSPWEMNFFELVSPEMALTDNEAGDAKEAFRNSLVKISAFARKVESPFESAFSLALYFLNAEFPKGDYDEVHWNQIQTELTTRGYQTREIENVKNSFFNNSVDLVAAGRKEKTGDLIAADLADVFGGMGSWNDIGFNDPEENEQYHTLTAEVFQGLRAYFVSII